MMAISKEKSLIFLRHLSGIYMTNKLVTVCLSGNLGELPVFSIQQAVPKLLCLGKWETTVTALLSCWDIYFRYSLEAEKFIRTLDL